MQVGEVGVEICFVEWFVFVFSVIVVVVIDDRWIAGTMRGGRAPFGFVEGEPFGWFRCGCCQRLAASRGILGSGICNNNGRAGRSGKDLAFTPLILNGFVIRHAIQPDMFLLVKGIRQPESPDVKIMLLTFPCQGVRRSIEYFLEGNFIGMLKDLVFFEEGNEAGTGGEGFIGRVVVSVDVEVWHAFVAVVAVRRSRSRTSLRIVNGSTFDVFSDGDVFQIAGINEGSGVK